MSNDRDMSGALFRNDRKEKPSHPDCRGDYTIDGVKYWISAWIKKGAKGKYMSLSLRPADEENGGSKPKSAARGMAGEDTPFAPEDGPTGLETMVR